MRFDGVWDRLHATLLAHLNAADQIDWSRAILVACPWHHAPDRPSPHSKRQRIGCNAMGHRAYAVLASSVPSPSGPIRAPVRHPRVIPDDRLLSDLLAIPRKGVLLDGLRDIELTSPSGFRNDQIQALVPLAPDALTAWLSTDPPPNQQAAPQDRPLVDQLSQFGAETTFLCRHGGTGDDTVLF